MAIILTPWISRRIHHPFHINCTPCARRLSSFYKKFPCKVYHVYIQILVGKGGERKAFLSYIYLSFKKRYHKRCRACYFFCILKKPNNNETWSSFYLKKAIMQWLYICVAQMSQPKMSEPYILISWQNCISQEDKNGIKLQSWYFWNGNAIHSGRDIQSPQYLQIFTLYLDVIRRQLVALGTFLIWLCIWP